MIRVARRDGAKLRRAVRAARLATGLRRRVAYRTTRRTVTLVVRGARRAGEDHDRGIWTGRIKAGLERRGVVILRAQL